MRTALKTIKERIKLNLARKKYTDIFTEKPLVSIRIPTLNRSDILRERAISSALSQRYKNIEIVVVGDHCIDNTEDQLKKVKTNIKISWLNLGERNSYEKKILEDPEIRWFMGPVRATNKATELCSGDWVAHLDDDDSWTQYHIKDLLKFAQEGDYEMVYGDYVEMRYGKKKRVENGTSTWLMKKYIADIFKLDSDCWRKKWDRVSDIDVFKRMQSAGVRMGHLKKIVAYVFPRPGEKTIGYDQYLKYKNDAIRSIYSR